MTGTGEIQVNQLSETESTKYETSQITKYYQFQTSPSMLQRRDSPVAIIYH